MHCLCGSLFQMRLLLSSLGLLRIRQNHCRRMNVEHLVNAAKKMETRKTVEELIDEAKGSEENNNKKGGLETY